ncbi:hypothetical protein [Segatella baroniae]|nr:hypothetical protein [Segatella baroniae]
MPELSVRSLLSSEGIRWFFGRFTTNMASPVLVWLVMAFVAMGSVEESRLLTRYSKLSYRERFAMSIVWMELAGILMVLGLLTLLPHAVLANVNGELFPSSFSWSLIPVVCFSLSLFSLTYALVSGHIERLEQLFDLLTFGLRKHAGWLLVYILFMQVYYSFRFVFF